MTAVDKALLTDLLDGMSGIHQYLLQDLSNEKLSIENQQKRQQFIQWTNNFMQRIQSTHPSIRPRVNTPGKLPPRPPPQQVTQKPIPSPYKPPPPIPVEEEPQDVYEVPENIEQEDDEEDYLPVEPVHAEEPQEDYLAMEGEEGRIEEETYEDPTEAIKEESPGLYEEAVSQNHMPPPIQITPPPPHSVPQQSHDPTGYMDPLQLNIGQDDKRASIVPEDLIDDWEFAYDKSTGKKKEKLKVSDHKNVVIKGWLEKLGGRNQKSWQKRYCVLSDIFMYFYEKESSNTYNNRIPMPGFVPNPVNDLTKPKKNQFAFKLSAVNDNGLLKDYYFRSRTDEERNGWIESIRKTAEIGRGEIEKRKSMTLPSSSFRNLSEATPVSTTTRPLSSPQEILEDDDVCENYEALEPAVIEPDQEDYVDVTPSTEKDSLSQEPQESYVELEPNNREASEEPQDYVEAEEVRPPRPAKYVPPSTATQLPLPPPPTAQTVSPPVPAHSPVRPDPIVDTSKIYTQQNGSIEYNRVFVVLWDFVTSESDELSLQRGDLVFVSEPKIGQEWWYGELLDKDASKKLGPCGLFPSNYSSNAFELVSS